MRTFAPAEIEALTGISPDRLRDWRRRGFLDGFGVCRLSDGGGWTSDPADPRLSDTERWTYQRRDVVALVVAQEISSLGVELRQAFKLAWTSSDRVVAWSQSASRNVDKPDAEYVMSYPKLESPESDDAYIPAYAVANSAMIEFIARPATILVDLRAMAGRLPASLRMAIAE